MKAEEASYLGKMLLRAMGTFSDGSNYYGNETRFEVSPFTNNFIGFSVTGEDNVAIVCNFTGNCQLASIFHFIVSCISIHKSGMAPCLKMIVIKLV